jgi:hypothetical protein
VKDRKESHTVEDKNVTTNQAAERYSRELRDAELEKVSGGAPFEPNANPFEPNANPFEPNRTGR